jgi:molybdopterin-binding protein
MRLSARNQLKGTVASVTRGPVSSLVKVDIGGGNHVTASLTSEACDDLGVAVGAPVIVVFKASSVMLGVE